MINLENSKTKENLMRAFSGESQARNRYTFAASVAKNQKYAIIDQLFTYTANQERAHAWEFMKRLKEFNGKEIDITASYPVEVETSLVTLLKSASEHEAAEGNEIYPEFSRIAKEEGFDQIATLFDQIASIELIHSERFARYAQELKNGTLFKKSEEVKWICTNCGYIYEGTEAPKVCPVCDHPQGYYILFENSDFE